MEKMGFVFMSIKKYSLLFALFLSCAVYSQDAKNSLLPLADELYVPKENALDSFKHNGASVLPITEIAGVWYAVLGKEQRGYWDDFCGKADPGENHASLTAARELWEEGLFEEILDWSVEETQNYIQLDSDNTKVVLCYGNQIFDNTGFAVYVTYFPWDQVAKKLFSEFPKERNKKGLPHFKMEKIKLGLIPLDTLCSVIKKAKGSSFLYTDIKVYNAKKQKMVTEAAWLRPFLVKKLELYMRGKSPSLLVKDSRILFYNQHKEEQEAVKLKEKKIFTFKTAINKLFSL